MTQPTAVQWMTANIQLIIDFADGKLTQEVLDEIYKQALKFEKGNMMKICFKTLETCENEHKGSLVSYFEELYNETFKSEWNDNSKM